MNKVKTTSGVIAGWMVLEIEVINLSGMYRIQVSTEFSFLPDSGFYRIQVSTGFRFLPDSGFYRIQVSTRYYQIFHLDFGIAVNH